MALFNRPKLGQRAANLVLLLLLLLHGTTARPSTAADHGRDGLRTKESRRTGTTTLSISSEGNGPAPRHRSSSSKERIRNLDVRLEFIDEMAQEGAAIDNGELFAEPPLLAAPVPGEWVQRCANFNKTDNFDHGAHCGGPLAEPCFERGRCDTGKGGAMLPKIYVYDQQVGWRLGVCGGDWKARS